MDTYLPRVFHMMEVHFDDWWDFLALAVHSHCDLKEVKFDTSRLIDYH